MTFRNGSSAVSRSVVTVRDGSASFAISRDREAFLCEAKVPVTVSLSALSNIRSVYFFNGRPPMQQANNSFVFNAKSTSYK